MEKIKNFFKHPILSLKSRKDDKDGVENSRIFALKLFQENKNGSMLASSKLLKAASLGDKVAIINIVNFYKEGLYGFKKNQETALSWLEVIIKEDDNFKQCNLLTNRKTIKCSEKPDNSELLYAMKLYTEILIEKIEKNGLKEDKYDLLDLLNKRISELDVKLNNNIVTAENIQNQDINKEYDLQNNSVNYNTNEGDDLFEDSNNEIETENSFDQEEEEEEFSDLENDNNTNSIELENDIDLENSDIENNIDLENDDNLEEDEINDSENDDNLGEDEINDLENDNNNSIELENDDSDTEKENNENTNNLEINNKLKSSTDSLSTLLESNSSIFKTNI